EALTPALQARFFRSVTAVEDTGQTQGILPTPAIQLHNLYGPTEASIDVTFWQCQYTVAEDVRVPIGHPIANIQVYLLDRALQPVPIGVPGELYIGGAGLARGYYRRPALTAERFIANPWSSEPGTRLYRTGDIARYRQDGAIEYLGRNDGQVKLRGYRIEPGEIEVALQAHPAVQEAVVVLREDEASRKYLIAYVVSAASPREDQTLTSHGAVEAKLQPRGGSAQGTTPTARALQEHLRKQLPDYMVPASIVFLERLPLTPNGKLDQAALPMPEQMRADRAAALVPARTPSEEILTTIWASVLGREQVGIHDNFFALGGDSMHSIQVLSQARERGIHFSLQQLYRQQTIYELVQALSADSLEELLATPTQAWDLITAQDRWRLPADVEDAYPLTMQQAGTVFHSQYDPASAVYHDIVSYHLAMPLNYELLQTALEQLAAGHPMLRTSFDLHSFSEPLQLIHRRVTIPLQCQDLRGLSPQEQDERLRAWFEEEKSRPFVWTQAPLLRFQLHLRSESTCQLTLSWHHAVLDGWSAASLMTELMQIYLALLSGSHASCAAPPVLQFRDFVALERKVIARQKARQYWLEKLHEVMSARLPRWRSAGQSAENAGMYVLPVPISQEVSARLKSIAQENAVPLKSVLLAVHLRVLSSIHAETDVLTGLVSNGRPEIADGERTLGLFLNTLPFRLKLSDGTWDELIQATFATECELLPYRWYPLVEIQRLRDMRVLFETLFNFVHFHVYQDLLLRGDTSALPFQVLGTDVFERTNFALVANFSVDVISSQIQLSLQCDTQELCLEQIKAIGGYYAQALVELATAPSRHYARQTLLSVQECEQLLVQWNATETDYPQDVCIHQLFERQVGQTPDAVALVFEDEALTSTALNRRANQLAHHLQHLACSSGLHSGCHLCDPDILVGIGMQRSIQMIVGLLAVLKAGYAYVPIDPSSSQERLAFMLADSQIAVLLTEQRLLETWPELTVPVICLDAAWRAIEQESEEKPRNLVCAEDLACVIYTSGSTGRPKGVMTTHRAILNRLAWMWESFPFEAQEICCQKTSLSFVDSIWEIFGPLLRGVSIVLISDEVLKALHQLIDRLAQGQITRIVLVPALLRVLLHTETNLEHRLPHLKYWTSSGEALTVDLAMLFMDRLPHKVLLNLYGSSEVAADVTYYDTRQGGQLLGGETLLLVPIGRPIANTQVYLLNEAWQPVPIGVPGELYIGGANVARGYWRRAELTAERFVPHPWSLAPGARLYRTGDLACALPDGTLEFLGRVDQQVKLRGYRIELAEIEAALLKHPAVEQAVVLTRADEEEKRLVAYCVARSDQRTASEQDQQSTSTKELEFSLFYFANDAVGDGTASKQRYKLLLEGAKFADTHNFTAIWTPERHFHPFGGLYPNPSITSAAVAAITQKVQIRAGSVVLPLHDPVRVAEEWAVVDNLSTGRVGLSFATGWIANDFVLAPEHYTERKKIMLEKIETVRKLWRGEAIALRNPTGHEVAVKIYPQPIQPELPVWLTSSGNAQTFRQAGEMGVNLLTHLLGQSVDELAEKIALYRQSRQLHGHEGPGHVTLMLHTFLGTESAAVREKVRHPFCTYLSSSVELMSTLAQISGYSADLNALTQDDMDALLAHAFDRYYETSGLMGTVSTCLPMVEQLREIGVDEIACLVDFGVDEDEVLASLHELAKLKEEVNRQQMVDASAKEVMGEEAKAQMAGELRSYLQAQLPAYMVPTFFVLLDALPFLPNGKVDRKALPLPDHSQCIVGTEIVMPQTPLQEQLAVLWAELLHVPQVGIHHDFFALGGHSLLAMQVIARMREMFQVELPLRSLFATPTIAQLACYLEEIMHDVPSMLPHALGAMERPDVLPLSFAQERLWFLNQWKEESAWYNVPLALRLCGPLHVEALERSLAMVVQQHEVLRTTIEERAGSPFQVIAPTLSIQMPVIDLRDATSAERSNQQVTQLAHAEGQHPFDLAKGPLLRVHLLRLSEQEHVLLLTLHHIVCDGWSMAVLVRQLTILYQAHIAGQPSQLPPLPMQYADYALWQRQWLQGREQGPASRLEDLLAYWQQQLSGAPALLDLSTDYSRKASRTNAGARISLLLSPVLLQGLKSMSQREGVTLFMTGLSAFQVLLMRYSGQQDIVVGTSIANRSHAGLEDLIGFFTNTLVLRSDLSGNPSFLQLLARIRPVALQAYAHQDLPFERLVEALQVERSASQSPLFQVFFALLTLPSLDITVTDLTFHQRPAHRGRVQY
ncbi:MAG: amino acid adenylation domain-containing protein, partial [Chloroflexi bacterium]